MARVYASLKAAKTELRHLSVEELRRVKTFAASDGGYQRKLKPRKIARIAELAALGIPFPPALLAQTPDGARYFIDGHHRGEGHLQAGCGIDAKIVHCNLEEDARWLFIVTNTTQTKAAGREVLDASRNGTARRLHELAPRFNASRFQVNVLAKAIRHGYTTKPLDLQNLDETLTEEEDQHLQLVLAIWTDSVLWQPFDQAPSRKTKESIYSGSGVLLMVGSIINRKKENPPRMIEDLHAFKYSGWGVRCALANLSGSGPADRARMWNRLTTLLDQNARSKWRIEQHDEQHGAECRRMILKQYGVRLEV
jgi:hypothetical protein